MKDIETSIEKLLDSTRDRIIELDVVQGAAKQLSEMHKGLQRRKRFRGMVGLGIKLDGLAGEGALLERNRSAAYKKRAEQLAEQRRRAKEEYDKPENVAARKARLEARLRQEISERKAYAENVKARSGFDLSKWLQFYDTKPDLLTVEIGHGRRPLAAQHHYTGRRAYIGIEANINSEYGADGKTAEAIKKIKSDKPNENISFIQVNTGFDERDFNHYHPTRTQEYNPKSELQDGIADVIFLSHVLDDPQIEGHVGTLLSEAARITAPDGKIVVSEYDVDWYRMDDHNLDQAGLQIDQIMFWQDHPGDFDQMQERFHIFTDPRLVLERNVLGIGGFGLENRYSADRYTNDNGDLRVPDNAFYMILSHKGA